MSQSSTPGAVTPISTASNRPGKPIKVGSNPQFITVTPNGKTAYVASLAQARCPAMRSRWGGAPGAIAITSNGRTLYAASQASGTVTPITTATNTPGKPIKTGNTRWAIVCRPAVCRSESING
jgi:DNA-binding beta-propeller fold protein YncE